MTDSDRHVLVALSADLQVAHRAYLKSLGAANLEVRDFDALDPFLESAAEGPALVVIGASTGLGGVSGLDLLKKLEDLDPPLSSPVLLLHGASGTVDSPLEILRRWSEARLALGIDSARSSMRPSAPSSSGAAPVKLASADPTLQMALPKQDEPAPPPEAERTDETFPPKRIPADEKTVDTSGLGDKTVDTAASPTDGGAAEEADRTLETSTPVDSEPEKTTETEPLEFIEPDVIELGPDLEVVPTSAPTPKVALPVEAPRERVENNIPVDAAPFAEAKGDSEPLSKVGGGGKIAAIVIVLLVVVGGAAAFGLWMISDPADPPVTPVAQRLDSGTPQEEASTPGSEAPPSVAPHSVEDAAAPAEDGGSATSDDAEPDAAAEEAEYPEGLLLPFEFNRNSSRPNLTNRRALYKLVRYLRENPRVRAELVGHAAPGERRSKRIGELRAKTVRSAVAAKGPSRRRFTIASAGADEPLLDESGEALERESRRVVLRVKRR